MNGSLQHFKDIVVIVEALCVIGVIISPVAGMLSGFLIEGILAAFLIALAGISYFFIQSRQVVGTYKVEGENRIENKDYSGVLKIEEKGQLLSGEWVFGRTREGDAPEPSYGTGLRVGNALAFTFKYKGVEKGTEKGTRPGVALYKIRGNYMSGKWGVDKEANACIEKCWKKRA